MKPRLFFERTTGRVIRTRRHDMWWPCIGIAFILGLAALGRAIDADDEAAFIEGIDAEAQRLAAFEAGKREGREQILIALEQGGMAAVGLPRGGCSSIELVGAGAQP